MIAIDLARKYRTGLVGIAANRDYGLDGFIQKLAQVLRAMAGNIDANFAHDPNSERMHIPRGF